MTNDDNLTDEQVDEREAARIRGGSEQSEQPVQHDQEEAEARGLETEGER